MNGDLPKIFVERQNEARLGFIEVQYKASRPSPKYVVDLDAKPIDDRLLEVLVGDVPEGLWYKRFSGMKV